MASAKFHLELDMDDHKIVNVTDPTADQDAATKKYVDDNVGGGGPPSGSAGGVLDGSYPNPGLAAGVAGAGLAETSDVLSVNVDGTTIEINSDTLRVKDGGITTAKLSFDVATQAELDAHINDTSDAHDASAVSVADSGGYFTGTDVEAALQELGAAGAPATGGTVLLYDYTVAGSDKATIDTGVDTPDAGSAGTSAFSGAYRILEIYMYTRTDEAATNVGVSATFNNDGSAIYERVYITMTNATVAGANDRTNTDARFNSLGANAAANVFALTRIEIPNYANASNHKVFTYQEIAPDTAAASARTLAAGGGYRSTSAITRFAMTPTTAAKKFKVGTRLLIYAR